MIEFNDVTAQWKEIEPILLPKLLKFLETGPYILGENLEAFEKDFAEYNKTKYAVGVSNGTDALKLAIQTLPVEPSTTVLIPANSHISNALAPAYFDLDIILIDCDKNYGINIDSIEEYINTHDEDIIVIATHLYGIPVNTPRIKKLLKPNSFLIEDCSQAHGAKINGQHVGTIGDLGVYSLYPTKNLGAIGDAGAIITNNYDYYTELKALRDYGSYDRKNCIHIGWNNRLDEIQALILRHKLSLLDKWNEYRKEIVALQYYQGLENIGDIILPPKEGNVHHLFPIRTTRRDLLKSYLQKRNIPTLIHYPTPIQQTEAFNHLNYFSSKRQLGRCPRAVKYSEELLSLPIHPYMKEEQTQFIIKTIKDFYVPLSCIECGGHIELMEATEGYVCQWCIRKITKGKNSINPTGKYRDTLIN